VNESNELERGQVATMLSIAFLGLAIRGAVVGLVIWIIVKKVKR
jgi:hypothetical protein